MKLFITESITTKAALGLLTEPEAVALLPEGQAMLRAVCEDFRSLSNIEVFTFPDHLGSDHSIEDHFRKMVAKVDAVLAIAPEIDGELIHVKQLIEEAGKPSLSCGSETVRRIGNKWNLYQHWSSNGILTPKTWKANQDSEAPFPWVVKLSQGAGSFRMSLIHNQEDWIAWKSIVPRAEQASFLVQEYLPGIPASLGFLCGTNQRIALKPVRQNIDFQNQFRYLGGSFDLTLTQEERVKKVANAAIEQLDGMRGFVGVDVMLRDDGDLAIEVNPRLTTSYAGLRTRTRSNLAQVWLDVLEGKLVSDLIWDHESVVFRNDGILI
jgi:tyramine---L-glutamate ligase